MTSPILCTENKEQPTTSKAKKTNRQKGAYTEYIINGIKQSLNEADNGLLTPYKRIRNMLDME